ncbi:MAG: hypothetical protein RIS18_314, partial [Actinomycetota bacterium]
MKLVKKLFTIQGEKMVRLSRGIVAGAVALGMVVA